MITLLLLYTRAWEVDSTGEDDNAPPPLMLRLHT